MTKAAENSFMNHPQTSPPPPSPPYPATAAKRRLITEGAVGINKDMVEKCGKVEGLQEKDVDLNEVYELGSSVMNKNDDMFYKDSVVSINQKFIEHNNGRLSDKSLIEALALERFNRKDVIIPYEKLEGSEFPLDLLVTDDVAYVGNEKHWPKLENNEYITPGPDLITPPDSVFNQGNSVKHWDDDVGQYPQSNEEFLEYLRDLAERQRLLLKGLFLLKNIGSDFVGRSREL